MSSFKKWGIAWLAFFGLLFLCLLMGVIKPAGNAMTKEQVRQITSDNNLKSIAWFVLKYEKDHDGTMPGTMKDVAEYSDDMFDYFYPPIPTYPTPTDSMTNIDAINAHTGYCLVHEEKLNIPYTINYHSVNPGESAPPSNSKIVVYEKPGLWSDGTVAI